MMIYFFYFDKLAPTYRSHCASMKFCCNRAQLPKKTLHAGILEIFILHMQISYGLIRTTGHFMTTGPEREFIKANLYANMSSTQKASV